MTPTLTRCSLHCLTDDRSAVLAAYRAVLASWGWSEQGRRLHGSRRHVLVSPAQSGWISLVEDGTLGAAALRPRTLGQQLSQRIGCPVLSLVVVDESALYYHVWERGRLHDRYCSWPGWHQSRPPTVAQRQRWKGAPSRLHPLCRPAVHISALSSLLCDYSTRVDEAPAWPTRILAQLTELLGIEACPASPDAHAQARVGTGLWLPREGAAPVRLRIDRERAATAGLEGWEALAFGARLPGREPSVQA